jgi:cephalosporin hydroxylase
MSKFKNQVLSLYSVDAVHLTDLIILGDQIQPKDLKADYLQGRSTYCWYYALASAVRPRVIAEIGSRFGYSLKAMVSAASQYISSNDLVTFSFDNESYEKDCLYKVENMLTCSKVGRYAINVQDTQKTESLPLKLHDISQNIENAFKADLFHVDGDHSIQGTLHDLLLAKKELSENGVILLDDIDTKECPGVKAAMLLFLADYPEYTWDYFPSYRGLAAIYKA